MAINKLKIGFLGSHNGSNMQAILDGIANGSVQAEAKVLISNNSQAPIIDKAKTAGLKTFHISTKLFPESEIGNEIANIMKGNEIELIILAGYMKKIDDNLIARFRNRIVNIHPALLPKFGGEGMFGMNVHKAVVESGEKISGATVHLVNGEYDSGKILAQAEVQVLPQDTSEILAAKVLIAEHKLYPETIDKIAKGEISLD